MLEGQGLGRLRIGDAAGVLPFLIFRRRIFSSRRNYQRHFSREIPCSFPVNFLNRLQIAATSRIDAGFASYPQNSLLIPCFRGHGERKPNIHAGFRARLADFFCTPLYFSLSSRKFALR